MTMKIKDGRGCALPTLFVSVFFSLLILLPAVFASREISEMALNGLKLSATTVVPSVFPFILLTDLAVGFIRFESAKPLRSCFEKIFKINGCGLSAFTSGILGGFPLGAHRAIRLYEDGRISKGECERLMGFANNASPGYVIAAVGTGMLGSARIGICLYAITVISAVISGVIVGIKEKYTHFSDINYGQNYSFVNSVKSASAICISIIGFVTAFSVMLGAMQRLFGGVVLTLAVAPLFEIGNAVAMLSKSSLLPHALKMAAIAFAISFSGLCVYFQTAALTDGRDLSMRYYITAKLLQGALAAVISFFVFSVY